MTELLQTRVPRELAARFKAVARAQGKSTYQVLRELAEQYSRSGQRRQFASNAYPERFELPAPSRFRQELKARTRAWSE